MKIDRCPGHSPDQGHPNLHWLPAQHRAGANGLGADVDQRCPVSADMLSVSHRLDWVEDTPFHKRRKIIRAKL